MLQKKPLSSMHVTGSEQVSLHMTHSPGQNLHGSSVALRYAGRHPSLWWKRRKTSSRMDFILGLKKPSCSSTAALFMDTRSATRAFQFDLYIFGSGIVQSWIWNSVLRWSVKTRRRAVLSKQSCTSSCEKI